MNPINPLHSFWQRNVLNAVAAVSTAAILATACTEIPRAVQPEIEPNPAAQPHPVYVVSHGWHTGLIVPASILNQSLPALKERFGEAKPYYEVGWGDKGFYQANGITVGLTLQAMFWSPGAIVHVVAVPDAPARYFVQSEVVQICLSSKQLRALSTFISASFGFDGQGQPMPLGRGIYGDSQFYEGQGRYHLLNTCNKWTAKGLMSAGVDLSPALTLTAESVMRSVSGLATNSCG